MSITNYGELKTAVGVWLNRPDLTSYIPDFITLGSARIYFGGESPMMSTPLRIPAMQNQDTGAVSGGYIGFPTGFLEPIKVAVQIGTNDYPLTYADPANFGSTFHSPSIPSAYTYRDNAIYTGVDGSLTYVLDYYKSFDAFTADADTNWLLTNSPSVYLYAALLEAAPFLGDSATLAGWQSMFTSAIAALNRSTKYQGGGSLVTRVVK